MPCSMKKFIIISSVVVSVCLTVFLIERIHYICNSPLVFYPIEGQVKFTPTIKSGASMLIPAAYTTVDGKIQGQYRVNGVTRGTKSLRERVSIHPTKGLIVSKSWQAKDGFQQHVLVNNAKPRTFKDKRYRKRRALCCDSSNRMMIVESRFPVTMSMFARQLSKHFKVAVNLDMGPWGYGWIGDDRLSLWAYPFKGRQTNWIYCE